MQSPTSADEARPRRARPLPQGRAILGGALVVAAIAVAGVTTRDDPPDNRRSYVTAAGELRAGHVIDTSDMASAPLELAPGVAERAFTDSAGLAGVVVLGPVGAGELIQRSDLARATTTDEPTRAAVEITFPVERDRAPGQLQPGERVTVLATHDKTGEAQTVVSVRDAVVVRYDTGDESFATTNHGVLTIALSSTDDHLAVIHDTQVAALSVIRSNSGSGGDRSTAVMGDG